MDQDLRQFLESFQSTFERNFDKIDKHFDKIDKHFDKIDKHFDKIDKRFDSIEGRLLTVEDEAKKLSWTLENDVVVQLKLLAEGHQGLVERMDRIEARVDSIDQKLEITSIQADINKEKIKKIQDIIGNAS